jgi:hypothetical protein
MIMLDFDPELTYTSYFQHRSKAVTPRQKEILELVIVHARGEVLADIDMIMPTLAPNPEYHDYGVIPGATADTGPKGWAEVESNYRQMFDNGAYFIESRKDRAVLSDDDLVTEGVLRQILRAEVAKEAGFVTETDPASPYYLITAQQVVFWRFDDDGKALGEDRYVLNYRVEPLSEAALPASYPVRFRSAS